MFKIITKKKNLIEKNADIEDITVSEAISTIYNYSTDFLISINWNRIIILLDGVSFSQIYNDAVLMLELIKSPEKEFSINFLDSNFTAKWNFTKENSTLNIHAEWYDIASFDGTNISVEKLNDLCNFLEEDIECFINTWDSLLKEIKIDLLNAGYNNELENFDYLDKLY